MASLASGSVVRQIESLFEGSSVAGMSDRQLLDRFTAQRDAAGEAAFAALVRRHGPLVLGVCTELLGDRHHAEDAFQAVFLILAQKAHAIRDPDLLGNWLYGVALRTSRCAKLRVGRDRKNEGAGSMLTAASSVAVPSAEQSFLVREQAAVLHEEIERLPRAFRLPVVLCYLEGLTVHEAARRLRCSHGTVRSRMARARNRLRRGLIRRGVGLPATVLAAALSSRWASASVSSHLCEATTRAAIQFAGGQAVAPLAAPLAREVLRSMFVHKLKFISLTLLLLGAFATSAGYLTRALARNDEPEPSPPAPRAALASRQQPVSPNANADRLVITGRVLDPDGKPVSGARVAVVATAQPRPEARLLRESEHAEVLGTGTSVADGRISVDLPRFAADRDGLTLFADGKGWALTGKVLGEGLPGSAVTVTMERERLVRGRILDVQGQPIAGVIVRVTRYHTLPFQAAGAAPAWPAPATTDEQGRFTLRGLGRSEPITLETRSDHHAPQSMRIDPRDEPKPAELALSLAPAQVIEVRTARADDGKPLRGVWINVIAVQAQGLSELATGGPTDDQGITRIIPATGESFIITANPPAGEPYLDEQTNLDWPKGAVRQAVEVKLSRGVRAHGSIIEEASGKPVASALVTYSQTMLNNPLFRRRQGQACEAVTGPDGKFQIVVPLGPGHLLVRAATPDYLHVTAMSRVLGIRNPYNWLMYPDALAHVDFKADAVPDEVTMRLRHGVTIAGRVIGPDGASVANAIVLARTYRPYRTQSGALSSINGNAARDQFMAFNGRAPMIKVRDGRFEIPGCDPESPYTFHFFDREHGLGATVELSGKSVRTGPVTVGLEKCGAATVRYKDAQGKPVVGRARDRLVLVISPGTDSPGAETNVTDLALQMILDPERAPGLSSDADGRVTFVSLIPGATYRLRNHDFKAEAGKTIELPEITAVPRR
jgi:RNA polymerase sigma factor (sigma-70 family)